VREQAASLSTLLQYLIAPAVGGFIQLAVMLFCDVRAVGRTEVRKEHAPDVRACEDSYFRVADARQ